MNITNTSNLNQELTTIFFGYAGAISRFLASSIRKLFLQAGLELTESQSQLVVAISGLLLIYAILSFGTAIKPIVKYLIIGATLLLIVGFFIP